jgi:hypothetical protein
MLFVMLVSWPRFFYVKFNFWFLGQDTLRVFSVRCPSGFLARVT